MRVRAVLRTLMGLAPRPIEVARTLHDADLALGPNFGIADEGVEWDELPAHIQNLEIAKAALMMDRFGWR